MILMMENFRSYPTYSDIISDTGANGPWSNFDKYSQTAFFDLIEALTWRSDGSSIRAFRTNNTSDKRAPQRSFAAEPVKSVCAQFIAGQIGGTKSFTEACNFVISQDGSYDPSLITTNGLSTWYGISIRAESNIIGSPGRVGVYYTIMTNTSGTVNSALIGYLKPWTRDRHYHVEFKVDHTTPVARIIVYVNGIMEIDATYDRDRIDSGLQTKDFSRVLLGGASDSSNYRAPRYSNVVIYTDDADTSFPLGPVDLDTVYPTANQGYDGLRGMPNADDATYATIVPNGSLSGTIDDLPTNPNPVLAADLVIRHGSVAGLEPSQMTTRLIKSDASTSVQALTTAAPGLPFSYRIARLPAGTTRTDINGMTFDMNAAG